MPSWHQVFYMSVLNVRPHQLETITNLLYSGKVWRGESLANLANRLRFAKLKPSKLIVTIDNPMADLFIRQTFFHQTFENSRFTKRSAQLSRYMVFHI